MKPYVPLIIGLPSESCLLRAATSFANTASPCVGGYNGAFTKTSVVLACISARSVSNMRSCSLSGSSVYRWHSHRRSRGRWCLRSSGPVPLVSGSRRSAVQRLCTLALEGRHHPCAEYPERQGEQRREQHIRDVSLEKFNVQTAYDFLLVLLFWRRRGLVGELRRQ